MTTPEPSVTKPPGITPSAPLTASQASLPTLGATIGSAVGALVAAKVGGNDPLIGNTITVAVTALFTALFHWVGTKFGSL